MRPTICISLALLVVFSFLIVSCANNLQGKAATPAACVSDAVCGDGTCGTCETCQSCFTDCCPNKCYDSDGGNNAVQKGIISGIYQGTPFRYTDECMTGKYLMEYYCGGTLKDTPTNYRYACEKLGKGYFCEGGACVDTSRPSQ
jgi:hypothetical protein